MSDTPAKTPFADIDAYIAAAPADVQPILQRIRQTVHAAVPDAVETISYNMPAFRYNMPAFRRGKTFLYFAAFQGHIGIYPPVVGDAALAEALFPYRGEKGNLKFPLKEEMPYALIGRAAAALARERGD